MVRPEIVAAAVSLCVNPEGIALFVESRGGSVRAEYSNGGVV